VEEFRRSLPAPQTEEDQASLLTDLDVELLQNKQHFNLFPEVEKV